MGLAVGTHDGMRGGRWFAGLDEPTLRALVAEVPGLRVDRVDVTGDARPGRSGEKWLNAWCVREQAARLSDWLSVIIMGPLLDYR